MKTRKFGGILLLAVLILGSRSADADTINWGNPNGGLWENRYNWWEGAVPGISDHVNISPATAITVYVTSQQEIDTLNVSQGDVTLNLVKDEYNAKLTTQMCYFGLSDGEEADIKLMGGGTLESADIRLGNEAGSVGTLTVSDGTVSSTEIYVGNHGDGNLLVGSDGAVSADTLFIGFRDWVPSTPDQIGSIATINGGTVDCDYLKLGSRDGGVGFLNVNAGEVNCENDIWVGNLGYGEMTIESGASVTAGGTIYLSKDEGGRGVVTINGGTLECDSISMGYAEDAHLYAEVAVNDGSLICTNNITVGYKDNALMAIGASGSVTAGGVLKVAATSTSGASLYVNGGTLEYDTGYIGNAGYAGFEIKDGATVTCISNTYVGGFSANVLVEGEGTSFTCGGDLYLDQTAGSFIVSDGASFSAANAFIENYSANDDGLEIDGGVFAISEDLYVGGDRDSESSTEAVITVKDGSAVEVGGTFKLWTLGVLNLEGGTVSTDAIDSRSGRFNWSGGELHITGSEGLAVNAAGDMASVNLGSNTALTVDNTMTVGAGGNVFVNGGTSTCGELVIDSAGVFNFLDGSVVSEAMRINSGGMLNLVGGNVACDKITTYSGGIVNLTGSEISADEYILEGGTIAAANGLNIDGSHLSGAGTVSGALSGDVDSSIQVGYQKTMIMGDGSSTDGYDVAGSLILLKGAQAIFLDADYAQLGSSTTIKDGSTLNGINGLELGVGETLTVEGSAMIEGYFLNQGTVNGATGDGEYLTFNDNVSGAGSYSGNVRFLQGFAPGNSPAVVSFGGGNVTYDTTSTLDMEIYGLAENLFDRLVDIDTLSADGTLKIIFGTDYDGYEGYVAAVGDTFDLFDFVTFAGSFDDIVISGLDSSLDIDTSLLSSTGVITIVAASAQEVPEPAEAILLLVGIVLLLVYRKRAVWQN